MPDGSVILVEMFGPRHTRVSADGTTETITEIPGGPNGGITVISLHLNFV